MSETQQTTIGNLEDLQRYLLLPRRSVGFKEVGGIVEKIDEDAKIIPVVITKKPSPDLVGLSSGQRSGLLSIDGVAYKVKGCRIESALETEGLYRLNHDFTDDAEGGQLLSDAKNEIQRTFDINDIFAREGFPIVHVPDAIIHYKKMFTSTKPEWVTSERLRQYIREFSYLNLDRVFGLEELVASVMRIKGDTRLPELYRQEVRDYEAASTVAYRLGLMAGAQKRVTQEFFWRGSNHVGNYVIFTEDGQVHLAMVDFEEMVNYRALMFKFLNGLWHSLQTSCIFRSMDRPIYRAPEYFKEWFAKGFREGYRNPDRREPINRKDLSEAFNPKV